MVVVLLLIDEGANMEEIIFGGHVHTAVVGLLLDQGADTESVHSRVDNVGVTPLFTACKQGHDAIVTLLLQYGAKSIEKGRFQPATYQPPTLCCGNGMP